MESKRALIPVQPTHYQSKRFKNRHEPESSTPNHPRPTRAHTRTHQKKKNKREPMLLNLGFKVFLSHSGRDKNFVRHLYKDLRSSYHGIDVAFFDEETLPKGKAISMEESILEEARGSALGVLVLSEDFFMHTKNPMLELEAFVAGKVPLLPLFFTMSVEEFKEKERWDRWQNKWEEWAASDNELVIENWRSYLEIVRTINGLEFCKIAPDQRWDKYIDEVVKQVVRIVGTTVRMCREDVYGMNRLCPVVDNMYKSYSISAKRSSLTDFVPPMDACTSTSLVLRENDGLFAYDLVGIYGFPGTGKTTLCKGLCDFYFGDLKGKVCYIDLGDSHHSKASRMHHVLSRLDRITYFPNNLKLDSDQVENLLRKRLSSMEDPVFLAIDHILPYREIEDEALMYLTCGFPKGSKILLTSREKSSLTSLISLLPRNFSAVIQYMPPLNFEEAKNIFKHQIPGLHYHLPFNVQAATEGNLEMDVEACVRWCSSSYDWSEYDTYTFHPLMLKSLAAFVRYDELTLGLDWKGRLAMVASKGILHKEDAFQKVFDVFDISYGRLDNDAKKVFLDLALCYSATNYNFGGRFPIRKIQFDEWIEMLHVTHNLKKRYIKKIVLQLRKLCFIDGEIDIELNSLMLDFAKHKAGADSDGLGYVVLEDDARWPGDLTTARHISIADCRNAPKTLDLRHVKGLTVLHLVGNAGLKEVLLSRSSTAHLRSMIVHPENESADELRCIFNEDCIMPSLGYLYIFGVCLQPSLLLAARMDPGPMLLGSFLNLEVLTIWWLELAGLSAQSIDLTGCSNLKCLIVRAGLTGLKSIRGPESSSLLKTVEIQDLNDVEELALTVPADLKTEFSIEDCSSLQRFVLKCMPSSISYAGRTAAEPDESVLTIKECPLLKYVDGLSQYTGYLNYYFSQGRVLNCPDQESENGPHMLENLLKDAGVDHSRAKATYMKLILHGYNPAGLGSVMILELSEAQHIGPLISAIFQARPTDLYYLKICCESDDSCGCDENAPSFRDLPLPDLEDRDLYSLPWLGAYFIIKDFHIKDDNYHSQFTYSCRQVKDLASLAQWHTLQCLSLSGCTSVEKWPDFAVMTSLRILDLSYTSLRKWPAGLNLLPYLEQLYVNNCPELPAKELILTVRAHLDSETVNGICSWAVRDLREDLISKSRDMRTVADALWELSLPERKVFFERWMRTCPCPTCGDGISCFFEM